MFFSKKEGKRQFTKCPKVSCIQRKESQTKIQSSFRPHSMANEQYCNLLTKERRCHWVKNDQALLWRLLGNGKKSGKDIVSESLVLNNVAEIERGHLKTYYFPTIISYLVQTSNYK
jgi:hypothetical protein